ncbi:MAG: FUSC family protein [Neisseriaceae bacterium]|nr:FUSC family protein [Neisseriaceae bacterium]MBP6862380.1 FUSC family protein [Neisseriaceae bacterium]
MSHALVTPLRPPPSRSLKQRTLRFVITVGTPLLAAYQYEMGGWVLYLSFGALLGFSGDVGGPAFTRLRYMAVGPGFLILGAVLGAISLWWSAWLFFCAAILIGYLYGLVESRHTHLITAARFLGYGLVFGYAVAPITLSDVALTLSSLTWAWVVSLSWDVLTRQATPLCTPSVRRSLWRSYRQAGKHRYFALATGFSIALAYLVCLFTGNDYPYWAILTILIVLQSDVRNSAARISERVSGTILGVFTVVAIVSLSTYPLVLLIAALVAATLRWPAFQLHPTFGTACLTSFILLLATLSLPPDTDNLSVLQDRLLATFIGCSFALLTTQLQLFLRFVHQRWRRLVSPP